MNIEITSEAKAAFAYAKKEFIEEVSKIEQTDNFSESLGYKLDKKRIEEFFEILEKYLCSDIRRTEMYIEVLAKSDNLHEFISVIANIEAFLARQESAPSQLLTNL